MLAIRMMAVSGLVLAAGMAHSAPPPEPKPANEGFPCELLPFDWFVRIQPQDSPLRKLQKERARERTLALAKLERRVRIPLHAPGPDTGVLCDAIVALTNDLLALSDSPGQKVMCLAFQLLWLQDEELSAGARAAVGHDMPHMRHMATAARIDAELALVRYKERLKTAEDDLPDLKKLSPFVAELVKPNANDTFIKKLQRERCRERASALALLNELAEKGKWNPSDLENYLKTAAMLTENMLELADGIEDRVKCLEFRLEQLRKFEKLIDARVEVGTDPAQARNLAAAARLDAEIELQKVRPTMNQPRK